MEKSSRKAEKSNKKSFHFFMTILGGIRGVYFRFLTYTPKNRPEYGGGSRRLAGVKSRKFSTSTSKFSSSLVHQLRKIAFIFAFVFGQNNEKSRCFFPRTLGTLEFLERGREIRCNAHFLCLLLRLATQKKSGTTALDAEWPERGIYFVIEGDNFGTLNACIP